MQIKIFTIPILGGEALNEEMNVFLRTKKVLQTEHQLVSHALGVFWCFCVKFIDEQVEGKPQKVDYMKVLDEVTFKRFSRLREIRKQLSTAEGIPAYAIFTDEELAELAKIEDLTPASMRSVKGIGEKKVEKYGQHFIAKPAHEKS